MLKGFLAFSVTHQTPVICFSITAANNPVMLSFVSVFLVITAFSADGLFPAAAPSPLEELVDHHQTASE